MTEFLENVRNAWLGWKNYTDDGKLAALLAASLFFLWCRRKKVRKVSFLLYASVAAVCCILPLTAALLMVYQTRFYDYEWIWSLVPLTAAAAYGGTMFLGECWGDFKASGWRRGVPATALLFSALLLAGGPGGAAWDEETEKTQRVRACGILAQVLELRCDGEICLWAPREIMEYAREMDGRILLPYGRNMWDASLNAYSYDTYDEKTTALYQWMEQFGGEKDKDHVEIPMEKCLENAENAGVNCILLPEEAPAELIREMEKALDVNAGLLEGYWIIWTS